MTAEADAITGETFEIMGISAGTDATLADSTKDIQLADSAGNIIKRFRMPAYTTRTIKFHRPLLITGLQLLTSPATAKVQIYLR
jgi:hypothetical protein